MFYKNKRTLTISDYEKFDETGNVKHIRKWWNIFNLKLSEAENLVSGIVSEINGEPQNDNVDIEKNKIISLAKIRLLSVLHRGACNILLNKKEINYWKHKLGFKIKDFTPEMEAINKKTVKACGMEINSIKDLKRLSVEIDRRIAKYIEHFGEKGNEEDVQKKGITFMQIVMGVFSVSSIQLDMYMSIKNFLILKKIALSKVK